MFLSHADCPLAVLFNRLLVTFLQGRNIRQAFSKQLAAPGHNLVKSVQIPIAGSTGVLQTRRITWQFCALNQLDWSQKCATKRPVPVSKRANSSSAGASLSKKHVFRHKDHRQGSASRQCWRMRYRSFAYNKNSQTEAQTRKGVNRAEQQQDRWSTLPAPQSKEIRLIWVALLLAFFSA